MSFSSNNRRGSLCSELCCFNCLQQKDISKKTATQDVHEEHLLGVGNSKLFLLLLRPKASYRSGFSK